MNSDPLTIPDPAGPVDDDLVAFAAELVERSGVAVTAERRLHHDTGRRRALSVHALLVGLICLALDGRPLHLSAVTDLLHRRLSVSARTGLGVTGDVSTRPGFLARYRCVRYCFHALVSTADPSDLPKNRRLSPAEFTARTLRHDPTHTDAARRRLEEMINNLIEASLSTMTDLETVAAGGAVGLDATCIPLYSRGPSRRSDLSAADPDGGWYIRQGDHRDYDRPNSRHLTKIAWALEATIVTRAPAVPGTAPTAPNLVLGLALARPGEDPGGIGVRVLASAATRGHQTGPLGADRAYSAALPQKFHLPARALGYTPVMDYRIDQLGIQGQTAGAVLIEGTWHCPQTPAPLITATIDWRAGTIDQPTYQARIAARTPYRLKRTEGPDPDGYERHRCPALTNHPQLACPLRPTSTNPRDGRPKILDPPTEPPRICTQTAVTIAPDIGARHRQDLPYGTETWARTYATLRNTIEGFNGYAKDPAHENLAAPARRRIRGIAAQSLLCALLLMAANLRKLQAHRHMTTAGDTNRNISRARRRRTSLADYRPT